eukprot:TRINITY_DN4881_c0_g3_i1.p1 TRINITY_DN4881_c0_g3~~TRINITY_DN4881_c0_g3_i1.p1  ORF type:complete len:337 (-),score=72.73 TRINITY_DN4881_c0_g3_i1:167-1177(-)
MTMKIVMMTIMALLGIWSSITIVAEESRTPFVAQVKNVIRNGCFDLGDDPVTLIPYGWEPPQQQQQHDGHEITTTELFHERVDHSTRLKSHSPPAHVWGSNTPISSLHQSISLIDVKSKVLGHRTSGDQADESGGHLKMFALLSFYHTSFHISDDGVNSTVYYSSAGNSEWNGLMSTPILFSREERVWQSWRSEWFEVPTAAESLVVELGCVRYVNQNCDGYLDDVCLILALIPFSSSPLSLLPQSADEIDALLLDSCECLPVNTTVSSIFFNDSSDSDTTTTATTPISTTSSSESIEEHKTSTQQTRVLMIAIALVVLLVIILKRNDLKIQRRRE